MSALLSDAERKRLVLENLASVHSAAHSFWMVNPALSLDDLTSAGYQGLVLASRRFDPGRDAAFATFAYSRIRGEMKELVISHAVAAKHYGELPELDSGAAEGEHRALEYLGAYAEAAQERITLASEVLVAVERLPHLERSVLSAHFFEDRALAEAAVELGVSKVTASRALARGIAAVRKQLDDAMASWPQKVSKPKRRFSASFKAQILRQAQESGVSIARLSRQAKVPATTIHEWLMRASASEERTELAAA